MIDFSPTPQLGIVVIGRNEGDRLHQCLKSILAHCPPEFPIVYVDSGSTDNSLAMAQSLEVYGIALDPTEPFSMARGRNTGWRFLQATYPNLDYIQFIDGDCELQPDWLSTAIATLTANPQAAIVCGRRREKYPDQSPYNRLADIEWDTPVGEATFCGGDCLARLSAIAAVDGYDSTLICGEEPELCLRLRQQGWKILRIDQEMTTHDAAMTSIRQWWLRSKRAGWAIAQGAQMHGQPPERYMVREYWSGWLWGAGLPVGTIALAWSSHSFSLALLTVYGGLFWRVYRYRCNQGTSPTDARLYALSCVFSKPAQLWGQISYQWHRWGDRPAQLIEYKAPALDSGVGSHSGHLG